MWPFRPSRKALERSVGRAVLEARSSLENPNVPLTDAAAWAALFGAWNSAAGVEVNPQTALGIPAVWSAVNFISSTIAALPLVVYKRTESGRERDERNPIYSLLHDWVNDDYLTSFEWRKYSMGNTLLHGGRQYTFIEGKKSAGKVLNLWPLDPRRVTPVREKGRRRYRFDDTDGKVFWYEVDEIIDVPFMMTVDNLNHYNPVALLRDSFGLTIALDRYASQFFVNGGVPPLAMQMPAGTSSGALGRAMTDVTEWIRGANKDRSNVLPMPPNHRLDPIGFDPQKGQLIEAKKHQIRETARIYMLPPVFLQDLEFGTFSNTEQQDLILVKHTLTQWLERIEQEMNAKLFGPRSRNFIEFNVDGLLRGDWKSRAEALSAKVQTAQLTPNEARDIENRPRSTQPEADVLHMNSAVVPLGQQRKTQPPPTPPEGSPNA